MAYLIQSLPGCPDQYIQDLYKNVFESSIWPKIVEDRGKKGNIRQIIEIK